MAHGQFVVSDNNPNDTTGGGGCVCDPRKQVDCKPPYIVCYGNEMDSPLSPHVVVCAKCVTDWNKALQGEVNSVGSKSAGSVITLPAEDVTDEDEELPI